MLPVNESDWKLFRKRLPEWQERCMEQLAESYAALLAGRGYLPVRAVAVDMFPRTAHVETVLRFDRSM